MKYQDPLLEFNRNRVSKGLPPISMEEYLDIIEKRNNAIMTLMAFGGGIILVGFMFKDFLIKKRW